MHGCNGPSILGTCLLEKYWENINESVSSTKFHHQSDSAENKLKCSEITESTLNFSGTPCFRRFSSVLLARANRQLKWYLVTVTGPGFLRLVIGGLRVHWNISGSFGIKMRRWHPAGVPKWDANHETSYSPRNYELSFGSSIAKILVHIVLFVFAWLLRGSKRSPGKLQSIHAILSFSMGKIQKVFGMDFSGGPLYKHLRFCEAAKPRNWVIPTTSFSSSPAKWGDFARSSATCHLGDGS